MSGILSDKSPLEELVASFKSAVSRRRQSSKPKGLTADQLVADLVGVTGIFTLKDLLAAIKKGEWVLADLVDAKVADTLEEPFGIKTLKNLLAAFKAGEFISQEVLEQVAALGNYPDAKTMVEQMVIKQEIASAALLKQQAKMQEKYATALSVFVASTAAADSSRKSLGQVTRRTGKAKNYLLTQFPDVATAVAEKMATTAQNAAAKKG